MPTESKPKKMTKTLAPKRGLGRGLSALIPESESDFDLLSGIARGQIAPAPLISQGPPSLSSENFATEKGEKSVSNETSGDGASRVQFLDITSIEANPWQPRQIFSEAELQELADSINEHGILQPILVRPVSPQGGENGGARFQLIAGERRWRAAQRAGLTQIPAIAREVDDRSALELAIIENVQRHDISALESAQAYKRLGKEFGLTQEKIAARVGKSRVSVANTMRLLDLGPEALAALREGNLSEGHGRALLGAPDEAAQRALLRRTLRESLSVREVERLARASEEITGKSAAPSLVRAHTEVARLETQLGRSLGVRVQIRPRGRGGALVIPYSSPEELQRLTQKMTGTNARTDEKAAPGSE